MSMKKWSVRVNTSYSRSFDLGEVFEENEELARCAALSKWSISEDDLEDGFVEFQEGINGPRGILPDDEFDVFCRS